jgi:pilus assembly protein CpaF
MMSIWDEDYYKEYEMFKTEDKKEKMAEWQKELLDAFLSFQNQEKSRRGFMEEDVPEEKRRLQLRHIIQKTKIPQGVHLELIDMMLDDQYRMGPAQPLWEKEWVSDIQIFVPYEKEYPQIISYTERGKRNLYDGPGFRDFDHARDWVNHHLSRIGLRYDPAVVSLDGMFPNGERIHVISGPVAYSLLLDGAYKYVRCMIITIRRFVASFTLEQLTEKTPLLKVPPELPMGTLSRISWERITQYARHMEGMADQATMDYLDIMIKMGKNHLVSGGTGVGKTTLANALTACIPQAVVLLVLEEAPEMQPQRDTTVIRIFQRGDTFTLEHGMKAALRMFPDRIFVAELRDSIAYVFLQAIQSGHDGSSTTVHASDCLAARDRTINMAASHPSAPDRNMIQQILHDRLDTILHGRREGSKRYFDEIIQLKPDGTFHKVMEYVQQGVDEEGEPIGYFVFYGPTDEFVEEMLRKGYEIPTSWGWTIQTEAAS